jgi:hypothetical protein
MSTNQWNKIQTPTNPDSFTNLTTDLGTLGAGANVVVYVASQAERDALAPPGGKYAGMMVARTDIAGVPYEVYDGTAWKEGPRIERVSCSTTDATWAYNVILSRVTEPGGGRFVSMAFIVARTSGGAFSCPTGSWTTILAALIPSGWRPADAVYTTGGFDFNGTGAVLLRVETTGNVSAQGVTGSVSMGSPTKLSASANWTL